MKPYPTKMASWQDSDVSLNSSSPTVQDRELEMLIIASIQTLKQGNKKCRKDEVLGYLEILLMTSLKKLLASFWNC